MHIQGKVRELCHILHADGREVEQAGDGSSSWADEMCWRKFCWAERSKLLAQAFWDRMAHVAVSLPVFLMNLSESSSQQLWPDFTQGAAGSRLQPCHSVLCLYMYLPQMFCKSFRPKKFFFWEEIGWFLFLFKLDSWRLSYVEMKLSSCSLCLLLVALQSILLHPAGDRSLPYIYLWLLASSTPPFSTWILLSESGSVAEMVMQQISKEIH